MSNCFKGMVLFLICLQPIPFRDLVAELSAGLCALCVRLIQAQLAPGAAASPDLPEGQSCCVLAEQLLLHGWEEIQRLFLLHSCQAQVWKCWCFWEELDKKRVYLGTVVGTGQGAASKHSST